LTFERQKWPKDITREYYLSFEDALWDLLPRLGFKKGSKLLVPSFYCMDVINNIKEHGYKVALYPLNNDLSYSLEKVVSAIKKDKPDIFVEFAAVGIQSQLGEEIYRKLPFHSLLLLDRVHSVIGAHIDNFMFSKRHLLITSSRKVSPFFGSMAVYSRNSRRSLDTNPQKYVSSAILLWIKYLTLLKIAKLVNSSRLAVKAELLLKKHDDLIGGATFSAPFLPFLLYLTEHWDIPKIEACKLKQASFYHTIFDPIFSHTNRTWIAALAVENLSKLRGYPIIVKVKYAQGFSEICRSAGFLTVPQLDDCLWSRKQKLFLLPLGPHLSMREIRNIAVIAQKALTTAIQYDTISA